MNIPATVAQFVEEPLLTTLATRDAENRPMIARGSGGRILNVSGRLEIAISAWLWPETIANLQNNRALAATFVDPESYLAFQFKGRATLRAADASDRSRAQAYVAQAGQLLVDLGVPRPVTGFWLTARDIVIAVLDVDRIFEQTPGPRAGMVVT